MVKKYTKSSMSSTLKIGYIQLQVQESSLVRCHPESNRNALFLPFQPAAQIPQIHGQDYLPSSPQLCVNPNQVSSSSRQGLSEFVDIIKDTQG
jgi:hypothetical protein